MKPCYAVQSRALASHIVAAQAGIPTTAIRVDVPTLRTASGLDDLAIDPKALVPALELDDGQLIRMDLSEFAHVRAFQRSVASGRARRHAGPGPARPVTGMPLAK